MEIEKEIETTKEITGKSDKKESKKSKIPKFGYKKKKKSKIKIFIKSN